MLKKHWSDVLKFLLFLGFGLLLVWWSIKDFGPTEREHIKGALSNVNYSWLLLVQVFAILSHISRAMRWQQMLEPVAHKPRLSNTFLSVMVNYLANLAFPRLGEVTRCGIISKYEKIPFEKAFGTLITERVIDLIILVALTIFITLTQLSVLGAYFQENLAKPLQSKLEGLLQLGVLSYLGIGIGLIAVFFIGLYIWNNYLKTGILAKFKNLLSGILEGMASVRHIKNIPLFIGHTIFIWSMYFIMTYFTFFATDYTSHLSPSAGLAALCFGAFGMVATQGGIGAYQILVSGILVLFGLQYELAYAFSWLTWTNQTLLILVAGLISLIALPLVNKRKLSK